MHYIRIIKINHSKTETVWVGLGDIIFKRSYKYINKEFVFDQKFCMEVKETVEDESNSKGEWSLYEIRWKHLIYSKLKIWYQTANNTKHRRNKKTTGKINGSYTFWKENYLLELELLGAKIS